MKNMYYDLKIPNPIPIEVGSTGHGRSDNDEWVNNECQKSKLKLTHLFKSLSVFVLLLISSICIGQTQSFRLEITNPTDVPSITKGPNETLVLNFDNTALQQIFDNYSITEFRKEFPLFPEVVGLKDIYLILTDTNQLYQDLESLNYFSVLEPVEEAIELGLPADYIPSVGFTAIDLPGAYNITEGSPAVKIGVFDTQLPDLTSPSLVDLIDELEYIAPFGAGTAAYNPQAHNHGITVASIIGATHNNGIGGAGYASSDAGVGFKCGLYYGYFNTWTSGIQEFVARGVRVVNMSFTYGGCTYSPTIQLFISKLAEKGIIIVVAAGNGDIHTAGRIFNNGVGGTYCSPQGVLANCNQNYTGNANGYLYPASYDDVISVTTMDIDAQDLYLNYNIPVACNPPFYVNGTFTHNDKVDIICPTGSAFPRIATSYAAPVVSGIVGLMLSVNPKLKVNEVIDIIKTTGTDIKLLGSNPNGTNLAYYQNGVTTGPTSQFKLQDDVPLINAHNAVLEAKTRYDDFVAIQATSSPLFVKQTTGAHTSDGMTSRKINWVDFDNDNDLDIYNGVNKLSNTETLHEFQMYENMCMGATSYTNVELPGLDTDNKRLRTIGWGDIDNDGDKDLLTHDTTTSIVYLYTNNGGASFSKTQVATVPTSGNLRGSQIADFNNDGHLDFIIGNRFGSANSDAFVYQGNGNGTFTLFSNASDLYTGAFSFYSISVGDINNDGNTDLSIAGWANGAYPYHIFYGDGMFGFTEIPLDPLPNPLPYPHAYGGNLIDYDNDGDLDIYYFSHLYGVLLNNIGNEKFIYVTDLKITSDLTNPNGFATWGDYDNDGDLDLYAPSLLTKTLYLSCNGVTFERADFEPTNFISEQDHETIHTAFGDADNDGDLDLYVNNFFNDDLNNYFYENGGNGNAWLTLKLEGAYQEFVAGSGKKTSLSAEGAIVRASIVDATTNPSITCKQMRHVQTNEGIPHDIYFGFGDYTGTVNLEITWPSGLVQNIANVAVNNRYKIIENQGVVDVGCACTADFPSGTEVSGTIGYDLNENCNCDDDNNGIVDFPLDNIFVEITEDLGGGAGTPSVYFAQTQPSGDYSILLPDGNYNVTPYLNGTAYSISNDCNGNQSLPPVDYSIMLPPASTGNDFCLKAADCDVSISIYPTYQNPASSPCPGVEQEVCMTIVNNGNTINNPVLTLDLDDNFVSNISFTSTCGIANLSMGSNKITVNGPFQLLPQGTCTICATFTVDQSTPLGTILASTGEINGQCQEIATMNESVECSFDPNDKLLVNPQSCGPENNIQKDELLVYRVRFQNEGNANAVNVVIKDLLDEDLDLSTFQMLNSSHAITNVNVIPGNKLIIEMNGIQLPPKDLDEAGSQGFILFGIKALPGVAEGTIVDNVASIYFDLNEAVVTNAVMNTLREYPSPDVQFESSRTCTSLDISYDFEYTGVTPDGATYLWDFGPNATPSTSTSANPTNIVFSGPGLENVTLTVSRYGCQGFLSNDLYVSSPLGCNGNSYKVEVCSPSGHSYCVYKIFAMFLVNHFNFCIGGCQNKSMSIELESEYEPIIEIKAIEAIVYPNPSDDLFNVELKGLNMVEYKILNSVGQEIEVKSINETSFVIDLSDQAPGIYFLIVNSDQGVITKKLHKRNMK